MKQAAFLAALALTRSVRDAARAVGMSRETAYRLRRKRGSASFAAAWDAVLGRVTTRKVTREDLAQRALGGLLKPVIHAGRHVATFWKPDNSALLRHQARLQRSSGGIGAASFADACFTRRTASTSPSAQRPVQSGLRFSAKARGPSCASWLL